MKRISFLFNILLLVVITAVFFHRAQSQGGETKLPETVSAPTSLLFSYQGQLLDAGGNPVTDSAVPMTFKLYNTATGGTACWTEDRSGVNAVEVENGRFSLLLGQLIAIPITCLNIDVYLELTINGETLSPREVLTPTGSSATLINGALGGQVNFSRDGLEECCSSGDYTLGISENTEITGHRAQIQFHNALHGEGFIRLDGDNAVGNPKFLFGSYLNVMDVEATGNATFGGYLHLKGENVFLGPNPGNVVLRQDGSRTLHLLPWGGSGQAFDQVCIGCGSTADLQVQGNLSISGSCSVSSTIDEQGNEVATANTCTGGSITSGAYIESNLQTPEELASKSNPHFSQGDLLCWNADKQQLELCTIANDRLIQAVASINGKPIVLGAEPIKVLGPVVAGDILVSSSTPGYAIVNNNPLPGTVIGQALEDFNGESGLIKAMIRKW